MLVIAEKPSVAQNIASAMGAFMKMEGYLLGDGIMVSWCIGHLLELAPAKVYDERYASWRYEDLPIMPTQWQYIVTSSGSKQYAVLIRLLNSDEVSTVVCATDAGREGELIFRLVYNQCHCHKEVKRLWISSMEESAIKDGFDHLRPGSDFDLLYQAALCRARADWLVGINASRLYSLMYDTTLNVGRVMTPTLSMIVERERAVRDFKPESFYTVRLSCSFLANSERYATQAEAEEVMKRCHLQTATVLSVEKKPRTEKAPKLYDLTSLQRDANRIFGYSAQQTLDYTQALYEKRLVTYPRTDSRYLTYDMAGKVPLLARSVMMSMPFLSGLEMVIHADQVVDDGKVTDHHAIIPTGVIQQANAPALPMGERNILELIAVRLLCALGDPYIADETVVTLECEGVRFTAKGSTVKQMGWRIPEATFRGSIGARGHTVEPKEQQYPIPDVTAGKTFHPVMASVREGKTTPPQHFTEDSLLAKMETAGADEAPEDAERKGLGTPATRAAILEKLVATKLIERRGDQKVKYLIPTDKGVALIDVVSDQIQSPSMTAEWEHRLKQIELGEYQPDAFIADISAMLTDLIRSEHKVDAGSTLFSASEFNTGVCPHCGAPIYKTKKGYFCRNHICHFAIWKDNRFFSSLGVRMTDEIARALLRDGHVQMNKLCSAKTGKPFAAAIFLECDENGNAKYRLEFAQPKKDKGGNE